MFDQPPENLPVQDIFEKVEPTPAPGPSSGLPGSPGRPRPAAIRPVGGQAAVLESPGGSAKKILVFVGISAVIVAVLGGGGYALLNMAQKKAATSPISETAATGTPTGQQAPEVTAPVEETPEAPIATTTEQTVGETPVTNAPANVPLPEPVVAPGLRDTDGDGLNDSQEIALGTDPTNPDSDADALTDFDEVRTWKSDPLNPDTDSDGYQDGAEVNNGYSPIGPGRIIVNP